jgi:LemA protein
MKNIGILFVLIIVLLAGCGGCSYNGIVGKDQEVKNSWGKVQSSYQRRADLIDNLVSTVKGAADFEKSTLEAVISARSKATQTTINAGENPSPENIANMQKAQGELNGALNRLLVTVEQYPTLKATDAFRDLQTQIEGTENRINTARNDFNNSVEVYNKSVKTFPNNIFAGIFGFHEKGYFAADPGADKAPKVDFSK